MKYESLTLAKGKEKALQRKHPWIFSGAFKQLPDLVDGTPVEIFDSKGSFCAFGFYKKGSIAVSVLSFVPVTNFEEWLQTQLQEAIDYRHRLGLLSQDNTNAGRLVFAEGDNLSGLIIDFYGDTAVIQAHHPGWLTHLNLIAKLVTALPSINNVYSKPASKLAAADEHMGCLVGKATSGAILENGHQFWVNWEEGQKTGFFLDQRVNRQKLGSYAKGKSVLNTFSYSGGFSIYALQNGATKAVSVDSSEKAIELARKNTELNQCADRHEAVVSDVFDYLKMEGDNFDVIILDPPAFAKNRRSTHQAVQAYKRLNGAAFKQIKRGGLIFTFSCSQHIDSQLFESSIRAAAIESKRQIKIVERLGQPADHPINIFQPEGEYLKGLILEVI